MTGAATRLQTYYQHHFPVDPFCDLLSRAWRGENLLHKREICIESIEAFYIRWQSVCDSSSLRKLFKDKNVEKVHTGAIFSNEPRYKKRNLEMTPLQRELVFDIDVNDVEVLGIDANDIEACDRAWPVVAFQMKIVKHILKEHFAFQNFLLVYSGRRGAHLSVYDARACELTDEARASIVGFLQPSEVDGKMNYGRLMEYSGFGPLFQSHILPFWKNFCLKPARDGGMGVLDSIIDQETFMGLFGNEFANKTVTLTGLSGVKAWDKLTEFANTSKYPDSTWRSLKSAVLHYLWPRLDANVTKLRNHLNKAVFSVHPKTARICAPITGDPMKFKPENCPKYTDLVSEKADSLALFHQYVSDFAKFVKKLKVSSSESWEQPRLTNDGPAKFSMVSKKRSREDDNVDSEYCYTDRKRMCADTMRVFVAVASSSNPNIVNVFFYTKLNEDSVSVVWPGYAPPSRITSKFPENKFLDAITEASKNPGNEVVCDDAYTAVLFHPRVSERAADLRMKRMQCRLNEGVEICSVNTEWGEVGMAAMLKDSVLPVWSTKYVYLS